MGRKYFQGANTASGYITLLDNNLVGIEKIYTLSGDSKKEKTKIFEYILSEIEDKFKNTECIVNPYDIRNIDGIIIRDIKTAFVDGEIFPIEKNVENIELNCRNDKKSDEIKALLEQETWAMDMFYQAYKKAKIIHDEWEGIYIKNIDFARLEAYGDGIITNLLGNNNGNKGTQNLHRFFGASTPDGSVNYIDNLTENLSARYFIKGRPGTGKSTFLKRLAKSANERGFDTELYYCSFDKNSLDMVIVPELSFCVFDSTAPHEMFPQNDRDSILDFYKESGLLGIDEKFERELFDIAERYKQKISEGLAYLRLNKLYRREIEYIYGGSWSETKARKIADTILKKIQ